MQKRAEPGGSSVKGLVRFLYFYRFLRRIEEGLKGFSGYFNSII